jgi:hypothetical protein
MVRTIFVLLTILTLCCNTLSAQQTPAASGSEATGAGGTLSYTVGQVDYTRLESSAGTLNLGVQQPYIVIANDPNFQILVFPNPTPNSITLRILNPGSADLQFLLYDMLGRQLLDQNISAGETNIPLTNDRPAAYILQVRIGQEIRTYKIIKTNNP